MTFKTLSQVERRDLILSVGTHRDTRPLGPLEVGNLLRREIDVGTPRAAIAQHLRINPSQVGAFIKLTRLAPRIGQQAGWGRTTLDQISFSSLAELVVLADWRDQETVADAIRAHRLTRAEVQATVQTARRSGRPLEECIQDTLERRPTVVTTHVLMGAILSQRTRRWLESLSPDTRGEHIRSAVREVFPGPNDIRGTLAHDRFVLTAGRTAFSAYPIGPDEVERRINAYLRHCMEGSQ